MASTDSLTLNTKFAEKNAASFPILADPGKEMTKAFGALTGSRAKRWTFYIDIDGLITMIDKSVKPRSAGDDLLRNLRKLKFPRALAKQASL